MQSLQDLLSIIIETPWLAAVLVGFLGLCVGSFLNVVIYRLPQMMEREWQHECSLILEDKLLPEYRLSETETAPVKMTLSKPASRCPCCGHQIRWYENIPLVSWLALRGKCSGCKTAISIRYPLVELLTMLASLAVLYTFGPTLQTVAALGMTWALIALAGIDFDTKLLPDSIVMPLGGAGLLVNSQSLFVTPSRAILGYIIGFLVLWVVAEAYKLIRNQEGMGRGDFKLLAALGAWVGMAQLPLIILLSSVLGAIIGIILIKVRKVNAEYPFGPYLAIAGWIALLWGSQITTAYWSLYHH